MDIKQISGAGIFSSGPTTWILPDPEHGVWAQKVDWYLNFQMAKSLNHKAPAFEPPLLNLLDELNLSEPDIIHHPDSAILMTGHQRLPSQQIICLPMTKNAETWLNVSKKICEDLKSQHIRIFLPQGVSVETMKRSWSQWSGDDDMICEVVTDQPITN